MSQAHEAEAPKAEAKPSALPKITVILAGGALVLSLVNTVLILMSPVAGKVEQGTSEIKEVIEEGHVAIAKKLDGLQTSGAEWQSVLKSVASKPDAVYKIVKSPDGLLTLTEIVPADK